MSDTYKFIAVSKKDRQAPGWDFYGHVLATDIKQFEATIKKHYGDHTYITPNEFKRPTTHARHNIVRATSIFIDFDYHMGAGFSLSEGNVLTELLKPSFNRTIPTPSKIIHSGRGIHFYIAIEPETDIAKYDMVAKQITAVIDSEIYKINALYETKLKEHDPNIGAQSLMRAEGSYNPIAQCPVTVIFESKAVYNLDDLITDFIPELHEIRKGYSITPQQMQQSLSMDKFIPYRYMKQYTKNTWLNAVLDDMQTLQEIRDQDVRYTKGQYKIGNNGLRNVMVFNFGVVCRWRYQDTKAVYESMEAFKNSFKSFAGEPAYSDREFIATYNSVIKNNYRLVKNATLIKKLDITLDEQRHMKTLIGTIEKKRRNKISKKVYRTKKQTQKQAFKQGLKLQAISLKNSGLSYRDIAKQLNISHMTAKRYCD